MSLITKNFSCENELRISKVALIKMIRTAASKGNLKLLDSAKPLGEAIVKEVQETLDNLQSKLNLKQQGLDTAKELCLCSTQAASSLQSKIDHIKRIVC